MIHHYGIQIIGKKIYDFVYKKNVIMIYMQKGNKVQELSAEVSTLKQDMVEIKTMLVTLTEGLNGK